jgi:uncharacterized lipoprotein YajG
MARLRRRVILTRRIATRFVETDTRKLCRQLMADMLTPELIARGFKVSAARPIYDTGDTELIGYSYDITALI